MLNYFFNSTHSLGIIQIFMNSVQKDFPALLLSKNSEINKIQGCFFSEIGRDLSSDERWKCWSLKNATNRIFSRITRRIVRVNHGRSRRAARAPSNYRPSIRPSWHFEKRFEENIFYWTFERNFFWIKQSNFYFL